MDTIKPLFNLFAGMFDLLDMWSVARINREAAIQSIKTVTSLSQKTVLDIGCGTGAWSAMFAHEGSVVSGIDFAENMIAVARKKYPALHFQVLAANHIHTFPDTCFDIVTASFVVHDITQPERTSVLREMKRLTKEWVFLFDYGSQSIPFMPRVFEWVEGSHYKSFVDEIDEELESIFQRTHKHCLQKGGAVYACRDHHDLFCLRRKGV